MPEIRQTDAFARWFDRLRDPHARARVMVRVRRLALGNPGDTRAVGNGVFELRIPWGPGYRVYYAARGSNLIVLLAGGDKRSQQRDIEIARELVREL